MGGGMVAPKVARDFIFIYHRMYKLVS